MNKTAVTRAMRDTGAGLPILPKGRQLELTRRLATVYENKNLLSEKDPDPLWKCCENRQDCWRPKHASVPRGDRHGNNGVISLPWVGPKYRTGSVAVLGINFNDAGGLAAAFEIAGGDKEDLGEGKRIVAYGHKWSEYRGTNYPFRSARSAALVLDWLEGLRPNERERPQDLVEVIDRIVRLQSVKCSPQNDGEWSKPTPGMWRNCPPMLLDQELAVLRPGAVIVFGADPRWAITQLAGFKKRRGAERLHRGALEIAGEEKPVFMLDHPRYYKWETGQASLKRVLLTRPLSGCSRQAPRNETYVPRHVRHMSRDMTQRRGRDSNPR